MTSLARPAANEFDAYYATYVDRVPDADVIEVLESALGETRALLEELGEARGDHRYAAGKWSVKEVVGHLVDAERTFALRALAFARCDPEPFPSHDQEIYVANGGFDGRTVASLSEELASVRAASLTLFRGFSDDVWDRRGRASGVEFTVRAMPFILAGHELHHRDVLASRYR